MESLFAGRNLNTGPRKHEAGIPTIRQKTESSNLTGLRVHKRRHLICTWSPLNPNGHLCTVRFNIQEFYALPTQFIYGFCIDL